MILLPTNFSTLDETCKLAVPKKTVRNIINNPWITNSIISAFDKKDYLYSNCKSTCSKKDPDGDRSIHKMFSDYKKFVNASGDPKKTWLLINQLRGKQRRTMKPVFDIDNKRII